jgi:hypothetical protein
MSCFSGSRLIKILTGYPDCENLLDLTPGPHSDKAVYQDLEFALRPVIKPSLEEFRTLALNGMRYIKPA